MLAEAKKALKKVEKVVKEQDTKVEKITIKPSVYSIAAGKKVSLKAQIRPADADNQTVIWTTSNKKYASVKNGVVTTKKAGAGKVIITAAAADGSGKKARVTIKIMKHAVKKIQLKAKARTVKPGKKITVKATVKTTGKKANKKLEWTSSNKKYAVVNSKGVVTAKKAGKGKTVTITAKSTDGTNKKASVKIRIKK